MPLFTRRHNFSKFFFGKVLTFFGFSIIIRNVNQGGTYRMFWIGFAVGALVGGTAGIFLAACVHAGKDVVSIMSKDEE